MSKAYRFTVADGRRLSGYKVEADNEEHAKELFLKYMSLLGAIVVTEEISAMEDLA